MGVPPPQSQLFCSLFFIFFELRIGFSAKKSIFWGEKTPLRGTSARHGGLGAQKPIFEPPKPASELPKPASELQKPASEPENMFLGGKKRPCEERRRVTGVWGCLLALFVAQNPASRGPRGPRGPKGPKGPYISLFPFVANWPRWVTPDTPTKEAS